MKNNYSLQIKFSFIILLFPMISSAQNFTQTIAFRISSLTVIAGMLAVILYITLKYQKRIKIKEKELIESKLKYLSSQMNPHFIFNSLNSIRRYMIEGDTKTSDYFITTFSSLMRRIMEDSKYNYVQLESELETLKLYLDLEKKRFEDKFEYKINLDSSVNPSAVNIPPMIIQPFLENAIWHGLMSKESDGLLQLSINKAGKNLLLCSIEDNGVGRKRAGERSKNRKRHVSTGMRNIEERIEMINKLNNSEMKTEIIDLHNDQNEPIGTRVDVHIQYISNEDL